MKIDITDNEVINGIINIDKPSGITSMDVVRQIRQATQQKRVGHGGTLDPMATGVIAIAIGSYTRLLEYILNGDKSYEATIELGIKTDTYDGDGVIVETKNSSEILMHHIEKKLPEFTGTFNQTPPLYSAKKIKGKRLYEYARKQIAVKVNSSSVSVKLLKILSFDSPILTLSIMCGKGFYVRSLANDLGIRLGCGDYLKNLKRTASGAFNTANSISLTDALKKISSGALKEILVPPDQCLSHFPKIILNGTLSKHVKNGRPISTNDAPIQTVENQQLFRAYNNSGEFIAIVKFDQGNLELRPNKVF